MSKKSNHRLYTIAVGDSSLQMFTAKIFIVIFVAGLALYKHIHEKNQLTAIQLAIPQLEKDVKKLQKENERLQYEIDRFESPIHLMELLRKPEYSHLKYPLEKDVIILKYPRQESKEG
jgi:cell division protein FtsL